jgi:hypothetical protein
VNNEKFASLRVREFFSFFSQKIVCGRRVYCVESMEKTLPAKPGDARSSPREEARFDRSLGRPEVGLMHLMPFLLPTKICDSEHEAIVAMAREIVPPGSLLCVYVCMCVCVCV